MGTLAQTMQRDASWRLLLLYHSAARCLHKGGPPRSLSQHQRQHRCRRPLPGGRGEGEGGVCRLQITAKCSEHLLLTQQEEEHCFKHIVTELTHVSFLLNHNLVKTAWLYLTSKHSFLWGTICLASLKCQGQSKRLHVIKVETVSFSSCIKML